MNKTMMAGLVALLIMPAGAMADRDDHDHREHKAHAHGHARLNIALEGKELHIELESPAANIIGFEHAARTEQQHRQVQAAMQVLNQPESLFATDADAGCKLAKVDIDTELMASKGDAGHKDEHHHKEKDHHEDEHGKAGHHDDKHHEEAHSDVEVEYVFRCERPDRLKSIHVKLFDRFPNTETLKVQFIGESGQQAVTLTKASPVFRLN